MVIFDKNDVHVLDVHVDDKSYQDKAITGSNVLSLSFSLPNFIEVPLDAWCEFLGERYYLLAAESFTMNHTEDYDYTLLMETDQGKLRFVKYKLLTVEEESGAVVGPVKLKFSLSATPEDFVRLLVLNMNLDEEGWEAGECLATDPVTVDFAHDDCFSALVKIAGAFDTEWEVDGKVVRVGKVEKMKESAIDLSYGYGNGILPGIKRVQYDDKHVVNRVYIEGGNRNISWGQYGNDTLLLPRGASIEHGGNEYVTDAAGTCVEPVDRAGRLSEDSVDLTRIYPRREGTVSGVIVVNDAGGLYEIVDGSIPATLDFAALVIPGETMTVVFQNGQLAGEEFEARYVHADRRFQLVPKNEAGLVKPGGNLVPAVGDRYGVFHVRLPGEYITAAENEALEEAVRYLAGNEEPRFTYDWKLDGIYARREWGTIGGFLQPGYFVFFHDPAFLPGGRPVRITAVRRHVNKPKSPTITLSNNVPGRSLVTVLEKIDTQEQTIDRKTAGAIDFTRRSYRGIMELVDNIYSPSGSFQQDVVSAAALRSLVVALGDPLLQYAFMDGEFGEEVEPAIRFDASTGRLSCDATGVKHLTLGIDTVQPGRAAAGYLYWSVPGYVSGVLEPGEFYYLYLRCSKGYTVNGDGLKVGTGVFFVSGTRVAFDDPGHPDDYTLLVAFVNSEENGDRVINDLHGAALLTPGLLSINNIASMNGQSYWKLLAEQFKIGNAANGLDWNVTAASTLTMTNAVVRDALRVYGDALLAGWIVNNELIYSQNTVSSTDNTPRAKLDGVNGVIELVSPVSAQEGGTGVATDEKTILRVDSSVGVVEARKVDGNRKASLSSNGIFSNVAKTLTIAPSTGISQLAAIVGLGFGTMEKGLTSEGLVGVYGRASNSASNPAPAYGGWFEILKANGLVLGIRRITTNTNTQLNMSDVFVSCYNSSNITVTLPPAPYPGQRIEIRRNTSTVTVVSPNTIGIVNTTSVVYSINIGESVGDVGVFNYDGNNWLYNYMGRKP